MKNIYEILKSMSIEIPEDKKEAFDKVVNENYKTVAEVNGINKKLESAEAERDSYKEKYNTDITARDTDLANLKKQLEEAGVDKTKLEELTARLTTLQTNYDAAKTEHEKQLIAQKKEFLIKEKVGGLKFTSNAAKSAFLADITKKNLPVEGDTLLGFDDFVNAYKEQDAGAFVAEGSDPTPKPPVFSSKSGSSEPNPAPEPSQEQTNTIIW